MAVSYEYCLSIQCGSPAPLDDKFACAEAGFSGVRSCYDPLCAPYCGGASFIPPNQDPALVDTRAGMLSPGGLFGVVPGVGAATAMSGCGCGGSGGGIGSSGGPIPGSPQGTATGPLNENGSVGCGCNGKSGPFPWLIAAVLVVVFVLSSRRASA